MHFLAISRSPEFSPNKEADDAGIFNAVVSEMENRGHRVDVMTEHQFHKYYAHCLELVEAERIFGMMRDEESVRMIYELDILYHIPSVTPYQGLWNAMRAEQTQCLSDGGIPIPSSVIISSESQLDLLPYPCWLKRGRGWTVEAADVVRVENRLHAAQALKHFRQHQWNGKLCIVAQAHVEGDLVKFYGVQGSSFFHWQYADSVPSKFGYERQIGVARGYDFSADALRKWAERASRMLDIPIYGGDVVVSADGQLNIIDFNDWPSFSSCRNEAALAIADYLSY